MMQRSLIRDAFLAAAVLAAVPASAKPGVAPPAAPVPPAPQTITFTNGTQVAIACSLPGGAFTLAPSSTEVRQVSGPTTVTCSGTSFHVNRPVPHHLVRCSTVKGGGTACSEVDPPPAPPPSSVVIDNASNIDIECMFPGNVTIGVPKGTSSSRRAAAGTGTCGAAGSIELAPNILVHTVRCVSEKKGGPRCIEIPVVDLSAAPPAAPAAQVTKESPRVVSSSPVALSCRASLSQTGSRSDWITVPPQGEAAFPFADVRDDLLSVECSTSEWKKYGVETLIVSGPHTVPTVIQCSKGVAAGAVSCKAK